MKCVPGTSSSAPLLAILASPPSETSGARTLARVDLAAGLAGCDGYVVGNLFAQATADVVEISSVGANPTHWMSARLLLEPLLLQSTNVLFAWGKSEPTGLAREFHRSQVNWLKSKTSEISATVWMVGDEPRHPSRWQRYTAARHPQMAFKDALRLALQVDMAQQVGT
ncbi:DUF1643 domain-containing protein [Diaminobutyricibacter tongyongensis]|uniref:DUF1643 domain-containing protein n=1 Tax=Leifsonia tongyongensis TaxID=1268043 RepID=A0A6L9XXC2_9MICO|nr:DUF1643 domain-containing protein [Diaminobutyricibacter tongyongensis]NEN05857.1 DUF1643 domain-containing protein [Diaminobutyricibacter tongyongensis]